MPHGCDPRGLVLGPGHRSDWCLLNPCRERGQARLRVCVCVCRAALPAAVFLRITDGLGGELARLQDQGTGGMAPLATPRTSSGLAAPRPSGRHFGSDAVGVGTSPRTVRHRSWAGPIFQGCPPASGAVRRLGNSVGNDRGGTALISDRLLSQRTYPQFARIVRKLCAVAGR